MTVTNDSLNPQQLQAVNFSGKHLLVLAGAGTGKTKTIIARAEHLIRQGKQPSRIVILSFTRKSAREIVERIKASISGMETEGLRGQTFHIPFMVHGDNKRASTHIPSK